ncbi:hypothetical protein [Chryseobacterium sp.]|uniref:hypothetical protein n=1 Tax=Chryseobacterium sp. TaxID=1871047 RepID=UPI0026164331|nr:hypothetical protein [Chryseobacterium sp.]
MTPFPKHKILQEPQKRIDFCPILICEFFTDMEVLQVFGEETKEYIFGLYKSGLLIGTAYFGNLYNDKDLLQIKREFIPEKLDDVQKYVKEKSGVWYSKFHQSQYAWISDRIITKVK